MEENNIKEVNKAFRKQKKFKEKLDQLEKRKAIEVEKTTTAKSKKTHATYDFTKYRRHGSDEDLTAKDVFTMFQIPAYDDTTVRLFIAGEAYQFRIHRDSRDDQLVIFNCHSTATGYKHLFNVVKDYQTFTVQKIAQFMLKASTSTATDVTRSAAAEWIRKYPFLNEKVPVGHHEVTMKQLLCDIMTIAQVAEAAGPDLDRHFDYFHKWTHIVEQSVADIFDGTADPYVRYFQCLQDHGIKHNSDLKGRVPYADEVFRKMLKKIQDDATLTNHGFKNAFKRYFPMHESIKPSHLIHGTKFRDSGVNRGKYHILFDKWIHEN